MTTPETPDPTDPTPDSDAAIETAELVAWYNQEVERLREQQTRLPDSREEGAVNPSAQRMAGFILGKTEVLESFQAMLITESADLEAALEDIIARNNGTD